MSSNHQNRSIILAFLGILACLVMMPPIALHAAAPDDYSTPAVHCGQPVPAASHQDHCKKGPPGGLLRSDIVGFTSKSSQGAHSKLSNNPKSSTPPSLETSIPNLSQFLRKTSRLASWS